jgi:hypothetical protein
MRWVSMLFVLCGSARLTAADEPRVPVAAALLSGDMPPSVRSRLLDDANSDERSGRAMTATGIALSLLGIALTIAGPALLAHEALCWGDCWGGGWGVPGSIAMMTIGPIAVVSGIPLWVVGQARSVRGQHTRIALVPMGLRF